MLRKLQFSQVSQMFFIECASRLGAIRACSFNKITDGLWSNLIGIVKNPNLVPIRWKLAWLSSNTIDLLSWFNSAEYWWSRSLFHCFPSKRCRRGAHLDRCKYDDPPLFFNEIDLGECAYKILCISLVLLMLFHRNRLPTAHPPFPPFWICFHIESSQNRWSAAHFLILQFR